MSERFDPQGKISPESLRFMDGLSRAMEDAQEIDDTTEEGFRVHESLEKMYETADEAGKKELLVSIKSQLQQDPEGLLKGRQQYEVFLVRHEGEIK